MEKGFHHEMCPTGLPAASSGSLRIAGEDNDTCEEQCSGEEKT